MSDTSRLDYERAGMELGRIEPHERLLTQPSDHQRLYKMMSLENFHRSLTESYLNFKRVDSYTDFSGADIYDGDQLPSDKDANESARFYKQPSFRCADYYAISRSRTYACCFSLENSDFIWKTTEVEIQKEKFASCSNSGD